MALRKVKRNCWEEKNEVLYISVAQKLPKIRLETSKNIFWQKPDFVKIDEFSLLKLKKYKNRKIDAFMLLAISLAIFELQRRTIPHFNPHNNSFWPYEEQFCCRVNRFWVIRPNVSPIFFGPYFNSTTTPLIFRLHFTTDWTFQMRYITSLNSQWFQIYKSSKLKLWKKSVYVGKSKRFNFDGLYF